MRLKHRLMALRNQWLLCRLQTRLLKRRRKRMAMMMMTTQRQKIKNLMRKSQKSLKKPKIKPKLPKTQSPPIQKKIQLLNNWHQKLQKQKNLSRPKRMKHQENAAFQKKLASSMMKKRKKNNKTQKKKRKKEQPPKRKLKRQNLIPLTSSRLTHQIQSPYLQMTLLSCKKRKKRRLKMINIPC